MKREDVKREEGSESFRAERRISNDLAQEPDPSEYLRMTSRI